MGARSMLLLPNERTIRSAYAVLGPEQRPDGVRGPGVLYLTSQRIVFEAPASSGVVRDFLRGRDTHLVLDHDLRTITNAFVRRGRIGHPWLVVQFPGGRASFDVLDPDAWVGAIAQAKRVFAPVEGGSTTLVERQVVKIRCRYCGSLANEVDGRCPYCGASL